ncbi:hypothetical protein MPC4_150092 [Methylocella tundrae]|uniref:Uncharacterized protein n=1 Tax=Methylocella tundrae TaxID=227605 RepID=A0A8B6M4L4_METTU|nr:hypothetical protein MPC1_10050005 [Methylocella tundrae]VTZ49309.1 hypothetical protein MPC4_150092 [Methylocella tundrae]
MVIAAFLVGSAAPIAAFMATEAAGGPDLHPQRSGGPKPRRRMAKAGDFASRWKAALWAAPENRWP